MFFRPRFGELGRDSCYTVNSTKGKKKSEGKYARCTKFSACCTPELPPPPPSSFSKNQQLENAFTSQFSKREKQWNLLWLFYEVKNKKYANKKFVRVDCGLRVKNWRDGAAVVHRLLCITVENNCPNTSTGTRGRVNITANLCWYRKFGEIFKVRGSYTRVKLPTE